MTYLNLKELSPLADEVIIVTSSLMKDMNGKTDMYRANAIRVLCRITNGTLLTYTKRYLEQAIVDKNPMVASVALVSEFHLLLTNLEIVKRWSNEVQEAVQSRAAIVQFHALALLHQTEYLGGIAPRGKYMRKEKRKLLFQWSVESIVVLKRILLSGMRYNLPMIPESALLYLELPLSVLMAEAVQPLTDAAKLFTSLC